MFRLEWRRQPSRVASHSHRAGRLPVTDMRRGSIPSSQLLQRQRGMLAELRQQSVRRCAAGDPCAAEVRDGGPRTLGSGIFSQAIAAYQETAKSTSGKDLCTTKSRDSTAGNGRIKELTNQTHFQKCSLYKVSVAASAKSSIAPKHSTSVCLYYIYIYI